MHSPLLQSQTAGKRATVNDYVLPVRRSFDGVGPDSDMIFLQHCNKLDRVSKLS